MTVRVIAADDQSLMLQAFQMVLQAEDGIDLVGTATDGRSAVELAKRMEPDVVLMDIRMPILDGVEATRQLVATLPETRVLVLTTFDLDEYVVEALRAGASGFLLKDVEPQELVHAITVVARGDAFLAPSVTRRLLDSLVGTLPPYEDGRPPAMRSLTEAELRVLTLVGRGLTNEEISAELFVSDSTVRTHVRHILEKLDLRDRIQAVVFAYDTGLVQVQGAKSGS
jgi:DNA-binding NarL/FixJ family response regulator